MVAAASPPESRTPPGRVALSAPRACMAERPCLRLGASRGLRQRLGLGLGLVALLVAATAGARADPGTTGTAWACGVDLEPDAHAAPAAPLRFRLSVGAGLGVAMGASGSGAEAALEVVTGDRRHAFAGLHATTLRELLAQAPWWSVESPQRLHLTAALPGGGHATSRYDAFDLPAALERLEQVCGRRLEIGVPGPDCADRASTAFAQGRRRVHDLLQPCVRERTRLAAELGACAADAPAASSAQLGLAVRAVSAAVGDSTWSVAKTPTDIETAVYALEIPVRLAAARHRSQALARHAEDLEARLGTARPAPKGGIAADAIAALIAALLRPGPCGSLSVGTTAGGNLEISVTAATGADAARLQQRWRGLSDALPPLTIGPPASAGGACAEPLADGWRILPNADGELAHAADPLRRVDLKDLPDEHLLPAAGRNAARHPELAPRFERGQTPLVWCRREARLGICRRARYGDDWEYQPSDGTGHAGFLLLPDGAEPR
jgi:hypothetical protein